jgi:hypothetical protein
MNFTPTGNLEHDHQLVKLFFNMTNQHQAPSQATAHDSGFETNVWDLDLWVDEFTGTMENVSQ